MTALPDPYWKWMEHEYWCCQCNVLIKKGHRALFFPFTRNNYCRKCGAVLMAEPEEVAHK